jgi:hypothetical protein
MVIFSHISDGSTIDTGALINLGGSLTSAFRLPMGLGLVSLLLTASLSCSQGTL